MAPKIAMPVAVHDFALTNGSPREAHDIKIVTPSMTRQEFMEECDINTIMAKYDGYLSDPMRNMRPAMYVDFTDLPDTLMGTMALVKEASDAFYRLPATVRREFDNDPVRFADYAADPSNIDQMRIWGLAPGKTKEQLAREAPAEPAPAPGAPDRPAAVAPGGTPGASAPAKS